MRLCCRYNFTTGKYPFEGDNIFRLFENIASGEYTIPNELDSSLAELLRRRLIFGAALLVLGICLLLNTREKQPSFMGDVVA